MCKITEKEYVTWKEKQDSEGVDYQLSRLISSLDNILVELNNPCTQCISKSAKGTGELAIACNVRYILETYGYEYNVWLNWREFFEEGDNL